MCLPFWHEYRSCGVSTFVSVVSVVSFRFGIATSFSIGKFVCVVVYEGNNECVSQRVSFLLLRYGLFLSFLSCRLLRVFVFVTKCLFSRFAYSQPLRTSTLRVVSSSANGCSCGGERVFGQGRTGVRFGVRKVVSIGTFLTRPALVGGSVNLNEFCRCGLIYLVTPYLPALSRPSGEHLQFRRIGVHCLYSLVYGVWLDGVLSRRCEDGVGY